MTEIPIKTGSEEMNTKSLVFITAILVLVSTMTAIPLVPVQAKATRIPLMGWGFPGAPYGDPKIWEPDNREHIRGWQRDFDAFLWTNLDEAGNFAETDPRLTGTHTTTWIINQYYVEGDEDDVGVGTLLSREQLLPTAYYDEASDTYTGWWEGVSRGKTWRGDINFGFPFYDMYFAFKTVLIGKGEFQGMKLMQTISIANAIEFGFEIQGYILDRT